jgi:hypothetical protein
MRSDASSRVPEGWERLVAKELRPLLRDVDVGATFAIPPDSAFARLHERLIQGRLAARFPEWRDQSIDGVWPEHARKTGPTSASLCGVCVLLDDQTLTPFAAEWTIAGSHDAVTAWRLRVGEPGGGRLRISGPRHGSKAATLLRWTIAERIDDTHWCYELTDASDDPTTAGT